MTSARKLNEALAKAKNIGLVEESFTLLGECNLTLRNLRPDEYVSIMQACQGLEDVAYLHAFQVEHLARSIVGINGLDFHGVRFIEDEPDPKNPEKTVKVELHSYLLKNVLTTWSKEAIYTAYRKFLDVVERAERKANEGVTFLIPEETNEDKYRRLLLEAKECESDLPDTLITSILDDVGFMRKSTAEEIKAAMEKTDQLAKEQEILSVKTEPEPKLEPKSEPESEPKSEPESEPKSEPESEPKLEPKLEQGSAALKDPHASLQRAIEMRKTAMAEREKSGRAAKIAALEAEVGTIPDAITSMPEKPIEVAEIRKHEPIDSKKVSEILDKPPVSGINPRFKPSPKF